MAGHKEGKYPFRSISLGSYEGGPQLVHYGAMSLTEGYLKPECEILEYDKARWHIRVRWCHPDQVSQEVMEANSKADFENILICMQLD
jgi:hypothetical protein